MLPPEGYKPVYMTSSVPLDTFLARYRDKGGIAVADTIWDIEEDSAAVVATPSEEGTDTPPAAGGTNSSRVSRSTALHKKTSPLHMRIRSVDADRYPDQIEIRT